jgi:hypothetical protein
MSFIFRCALFFVDTYAHTLLLEVISIFQLPKSMMRLGRFRATLTCLLLCFPDPRLLMSDLTIVWPEVSRDTTMIASRQTTFFEMLLERFCKFKISIFTNNKVLTSLRYMPPMGRDIFI